jgi:HPt (histidine-containing phosphotransfer) domain-containing protein
MTEAVNNTVLAELQALLENDFVILVDRFFSDGQQRIEKICVGIDNFDFNSLYMEAHGLKGSSQNIGAARLAELSGQLEIMGREKNLAAAGQILSALQNEFAAVNQALRAFSAT